MKGFNASTREQKALLGAGVLFVGLLGFSYYHIYTLHNEVSKLQDELSTTKLTLQEQNAALLGNLAQLDESFAAELARAQSSIASEVNTVRNQVGGVAEALGEVSGSVNTLEKLTQTDPELLQKYSKVFFLNEHYAPERVLGIPTTFLYDEDEPELIHAGVHPKLVSLLAASLNDGKELYVRSAYRSFDEQHALKGHYTVTYGAGTANTFSADQGYSEHQLGTTVDFITTGLGGQLDGFEKTDEYKWLQDNAHRYGFTLSYPPNNEFYIFEPWHWRYVGEKLATKLKNEDKFFYDLDQREIDEFLVDLFE